MSHPNEFLKNLEIHFTKNNKRGTSIFVVKKNAHIMNSRKSLRIIRDLETSNKIKMKILLLLTRIERLNFKKKTPYKIATLSATTTPSKT